MHVFTCGGSNLICALTHSSLTYIRRQGPSVSFQIAIWASLANFRRDSCPLLLSVEIQLAWLLQSSGDPNSSLQALYSWSNCPAQDCPIIKIRGELFNLIVRMNGRLNYFKREHKSKRWETVSLVNLTGGLGRHMQIEGIWKTNVCLPVRDICRLAPCFPS